MIFIFANKTEKNMIIISLNYTLIIKNIVREKNIYIIIHIISRKLFIKFVSFLIFAFYY